MTELLPSLAKADYSETASTSNQVLLNGIYLFRKILTEAGGSSDDEANAK